MGFRGVYKHKTSVSKIGMFFFLTFISVILHAILSYCLIFFADSSAILAIQSRDLTDQYSVNFLKLIQMLTSAGLFITPVVLYSYLTEFDLQFGFLRRQSVILVCAIMILVTPFIALLLEWNMQISFPKWLAHFDQNSEDIINAFLKMNTTWDLLYTLLVLAVIPAIGEELLFRGCLQQSLNFWLRNHHFAILISAFLFSVIHLDTQGLIARFFLGVLLGYFFYWSKSLWLPILAHFVNNALTVFLSFPGLSIDESINAVLKEGEITLALGLSSLASVLLLLYVLYQYLGTKKG